MKITNKSKLTKFFESSVDSADKDDVDLMIKTSLQKGISSETKPETKKETPTNFSTQESFEIKHHGKNPKI
jgi:hypothetical protein